MRWDIWHARECFKFDREGCETMGKVYRMVLGLGFPGGRKDKLGRCSSIPRLVAFGVRGKGS